MKKGLYELLLLHFLYIPKTALKIVYLFKKWVYTRILLSLKN